MPRHIKKLLKESKQGLLRIYADELKAVSYPGDKHLFGWDDYPHPGIVALAQLPSAPHHFQERLPNGGSAAEVHAWGW